MNREEKFFNALRDVFVGAKIEGESGYINLMRIKSHYYTEGVFPKLQQDINEALKPFPGFREELFEKLYDFFHRYFSESGSIYFRYTPLHQNVYEKVYTDDKDVMLFWKTHMLYYVKTDRLFKSMEMDVDGRKFFFDVAALEHKKANEKRDIVYSFKDKRKDGALIFTVAYSEKGKKTKTDDILKTLRKNGDKINEDTLERAFRVFEKQSEVDYFINKDAKAFLEEQFNLWIYQYMFSGVSEWTEVRIKQLQVLKEIAFKIIAFISQFENELVKIWNKPKFVLNSNYVITLDRMAEKGIALIEKILTHKNIGAQIKEWQQLGIVDDSFKKTAVLEKGGKGKRLTKRFQHLPIDTKHFKDLELDVLSMFENHDASLDGWLIKSENNQALTNILPKFLGKVKSIYIDPPYNTGSDEFIYKDKFQHSTWLTMMENRLTLAKRFLRVDGVVFVSIDDNESASLRRLMDGVFGTERFLTTLFIQVRYPEKTLTKDMLFHKLIEQVHVYALEKKGMFREKEPYDIAKFKWYVREKGKAKLVLDLGGKKVEVFPIGSYEITKRDASEDGLKEIWATGKLLDGTSSGRFFRDFLVGRESHDGYGSLYKVYGIGEDKFDYRYFTGPKRKGATKGKYYQGVPAFRLANEGQLQELTINNFFDFAANFGNCRHEGGVELRSGKKPEAFLEKLLGISTEPGDLVFDFCLGSGTTDAVAHKMSRKWIGVELGEQFEQKAKVRMKNVLGGEQTGISERWKWKGSGFFKYYEMEQYEDVLHRAKYADADLFNDPNKDPYHQYVFLRDLKMLEALEVDTSKNRIKVDLSKLYSGIDIAETLSNLTGRWIKHITGDSVEFEDGEVVDTKNLDWKRIKPLIWW